MGEQKRVRETKWQAEERVDKAHRDKVYLYFKAEDKSEPLYKIDELIYRYPFSPCTLTHTHIHIKIDHPQTPICMCLNIIS